MIKNLSFQSKLFIMFSIVVIVMVLASFGVFYHYYAENITSSISDVNLREANTISKQLDGIVASMESAAMQVKYNPFIINEFIKAYYSVDKGKFIMENTASIRSIEDIILSITAANLQKYYRITVFNDGGAFIGIGAFYDKNKTLSVIKENNWYSMYAAQNAYRILIPTHVDRWNDQNVHVISEILRIDYGGLNYGLVEVQVAYDELKKQLITKDFHTKGKSLYIFDQNGNVLYPVEAMNIQEKDEHAKTYYDCAKTDNIEIVFNKNIKNDSLYIKKSQFTGWTVVMVQDRSVLLAPVRSIGIVLFFLAIFLTLVSLLVIFIFTRLAVRPLRQLSATMDKINLNSLNSEIKFENTQNEIMKLNNSFSTMLDRIEKSKNQVLEAHSREIQSKFEALQAQMNPHFLCNTLSMVAMLAYETKNEKIFNISTQLSNMFRYVIQQGDGKTTLREEIKYTRNYLEIMKVRYESHLTYSIDIVKELFEIEVPQLSIQPFVENSIKHGFSEKRPPWNIYIIGRGTIDSWELEITDNGQGFCQEVIGDIEERIREIKKNGVTGRKITKASGMGIINTFVRFYILFDKNVDFQIINRNEITTSIVIRVKSLLHHI